MYFHLFKIAYKPKHRVIAQLWVWQLWEMYNIHLGLCHIHSSIEIVLKY